MDRDRIGGEYNFMNYGRAVVEDTLDDLGIQYEEQYGTDWAKAWCPLHNDSSPSLTVHIEEGAWRCFAHCGSSGDLAQLVTLVTGEVTEDVRLRMGRHLLNDPQAIRKAMQPKRSKVTIVSDEVPEYRYEHGKVPKYFIDRGFTLETAKRWDVGWDPQLKALVIPVYQEGRLKGVVRRPIYWKKGDPSGKYLNSFGLSGVLLGTDLISSSVREVTVVEGPLDAIWLQQCGYPAVSTLGSNLSDVQAELLVRRFWTVIFAYDGDFAGQAGLSKAKNKLKKLRVKYLKIPEGRKDVQECTKEELDIAYSALHQIT